MKRISFALLVLGVTLFCSVDTAAGDVEIALEAGDAETLLVAWLGELLYLHERDGCVFIGFEVCEITPTHLQAVARGGPPRERRGHLKAVTFSELEIRCDAEGCETTVVFDA